MEIIGVGAIGSHIGIFLARLGIWFNCYDYDNVERKNLNNQAFQEEHIGMQKVEAMKMLTKAVNNNIVSACQFHNKKITKEEILNMKGTIFLCVDSIRTRKELVKELVNNNKDITVIDTRMGRESGRVLMFNASNREQVRKYMNTLFDESKTLNEQVCQGIPDIGFISSLLASNALIMNKNRNTDKEINDLNYSTYWFEYLTEKW